jgi:hypothetical protein
VCIEDKYYILPGQASLVVVYPGAEKTVVVKKI